VLTIVRPGLGGGKQGIPPLSRGEEATCVTATTCAQCAPPGPTGPNSIVADLRGLTIGGLLPEHHKRALRKAGRHTFPVLALAGETRCQQGAVCSDAGTCILRVRLLRLGPTTFGLKSDGAERHRRQLC